MGDWERDNRQALNRFLNIRRRTKEAAVDATVKEVSVDATDKKPSKKSIKRRASIKEPAKKRKSIEKSSPVRASVPLYSTRKSMRMKKPTTEWERY
jgi:hypothetical protein